ERVRVTGVDLGTVTITDGPVDGLAELARGDLDSAGLGVDDHLVGQRSAGLGDAQVDRRLDAGLVVATDDLAGEPDLTVVVANPLDLQALVVLQVLLNLDGRLRGGLDVALDLRVGEPLLRSGLTDGELEATVAVEGRDDLATEDLAAIDLLIEAHGVAAGELRGALQFHVVGLDAERLRVGVEVSLGHLSRLRVLR